MTHCQFFEDILDDSIPFIMIRNVSDDNLFSVMFNDKPEHTQQLIEAKTQPIVPEQTLAIPNFIQYRKVKNEKSKQSRNQRRDYKKNICGYITKKIVREFMSQIYKEKVEKLCDKYQCQYEEVLDFYDKKIERITGPTHLDMLLNDSREHSSIKRCFREFFIWFLRHRYLRYLLSEGKMEKKEAYVDYKNKTLLYLGSLEDKLSCNLSSYTELQSHQTISLSSN